MAELKDFIQQEALPEIPVDAFKKIPQNTSFKVQYDAMRPFKDDSVFIFCTVGDIGRIRTIVNINIVPLLKVSNELIFVFNQIAKTQYGEDYAQFNIEMK